MVRILVFLLFLRDGYPLISFHCHSFTLALCVVSDDYPYMPSIDAIVAIWNGVSTKGRHVRPDLQ